MPVPSFLDRRDVTGVRKNDSQTHIFSCKQFEEQNVTTKFNEGWVFWAFTGEENDVPFDLEILKPLNNLSD